MEFYHDLSPLARVARSYDELAGGFAAAGLVAEGFLAPRCFGGGAVVLATADAVTATATTTRRLVAAFITTPLTDGRLPLWRLRPALPILTFWCCSLPITPKLAVQFSLIRRTSPLGK